MTSCELETVVGRQWATPTSPTAVTLVDDDTAVISADDPLDSDGLYGLAVQTAGAYGATGRVGADGRQMSPLDALRALVARAEQDVDRRAREIADRHTTASITAQLAVCRTVGPDATTGSDPLEHDAWTRAAILVDLAASVEAKHHHAALVDDDNGHMLAVLAAADTGLLTIRSGALWHRGDSVQPPGPARWWEQAVDDLRHDQLLTDSIEPATTPLGWAVAHIERQQRGTT